VVPRSALSPHGSVDPLVVHRVLRELREAGHPGTTKERLRQVIEAELRDQARTRAASPWEAQALLADLAERMDDSDGSHKWAQALNRRIERALSALARDGAVINREAVPKSRTHRYILQAGPRWDRPVTPEARLALDLAAMALTQFGGGRWRGALTPLETLANDHMTGRDQSHFKRLASSVKVQGGRTGGAPTGPDPVLDDLLKALAEERMVALNLEGHAPLKLAPMALVLDLSAGGTLVLGWDQARREPWSCLTAQIGEVTILAEPAVVSDSARMQRALDYRIGAGVSGAEPFDVVVRITGRERVAALTRCPPALPCWHAMPEEDGEHLLVRFKANLEQGPANWVLGFGRGATVLAPEGLRRKVGAELRSALANYEGPRA
jgi:predicted DNA-binding transcriptional regulator YafY